jgi:hypothetical protein
MPEIMSAEELVLKVRAMKGEEYVIPDWYDCENIVRSRDSAMLEKYKEAICKGCDGYCTKRGRLKCSHMVALDSSLAEINNK